MIAISVNQSYPELYRFIMKDGSVHYDPNNEQHRHIMYECTCLQWKMSQVSILNHIRNYDHYYCAVLNGVVQDVYEMNHMRPFISMQQAIDEGIIKFDQSQYGIVNNFRYRRIGFLEVDQRINRYEANRIYFYLSELADNEIRKNWRGTHVNVNVCGFRYITP